MDVSGVNRWPRLSHYARMDPDSFNLGPSRKRSTRQISRHYLDTFRALLPPFGVRRQLVAFVRAPHPRLLHGIHTCLSLRRQFDILILLRQLANFKANYDIHARRCLLSREITYFHVHFYSRRPGLFSFSFFLFLFFPNSDRISERRVLDRAALKDHFGVGESRKVLDKPNAPLMQNLQRLRRRLVECISSAIDYLFLL